MKKDMRMIFISVIALINQWLHSMATANLDSQCSHLEVHLLSKFGSEREDFKFCFIKARTELRKDFRWFFLEEMRTRQFRFAS